MKLTNERQIKIHVAGDVAKKVTPDGLVKVALQAKFTLKTTSDSDFVEFWANWNDEEILVWQSPKVQHMDWYAFVGIAIHNIAFETGATELQVLVDLLKASGEEVEL